MNDTKTFLKEYQKKLEKTLKEHEILVVQNWKDRLDKILLKRPEGIAALQLEIKKISTMMENRIKILKKDI